MTYAQKDSESAPFSARFGKEVRRMGEHEKEILKIVAAALPDMDDMKKGELLGYGKAMVDMKKKDKDQEEHTKE